VISSDGKYQVTETFQFTGAAGNYVEFPAQAGVQFMDAGTKKEIPAKSGKVKITAGMSFYLQAPVSQASTAKTYSSGKLNQVFAAYMNYNQRGSQFNEPGVLLTDAVMFAIGASHLELGDGHMLCHEYFPNRSLAISSSLRKALVHYYDFLVAYENLLRDGGTESVADISSTSSKMKINSWPPQMQKVTSYSKTVGNREVIHLLNFNQANSLSWRDMDSDMPEPKALSSVPLKLRASGVKRLWVATPDALGGAPQELAFQESGGYVTFTLPSLKYWTMIVVEK
jgi:dextranase